VLIQQQRQQKRLQQRQQQQQQQGPQRQQQVQPSAAAAGTHNCSVGCGLAVEPVCVAGNVTIQNRCLAHCQGLAVLQQGSCTVQGEGSNAGKNNTIYCCLQQLPRRQTGPVSTANVTAAGVLGPTWPTATVAVMKSIKILRCGCCIIV
jgi:hypothetical protein